MSVVIVGGNECMVRCYKDLCSEYNCSAKVIPKMSSALKNIGTPDMLILFTNTVSHKMANCALNGIKNGSTNVVRCRSSSVSALRNILSENVKENANV